jgi:hypothetical protein
MEICTILWEEHLEAALEMLKVESVPDSISAPLVFRCGDFAG